MTESAQGNATGVFSPARRMTLNAFLSECARRGITLTVTDAGNLRYRVAGNLPPAVRNTLTRYKAQIIVALTAQEGVWTGASAAEVSVLPDGRKLYQHAEGDWRYVPPGGDPADFIENFPPNLQAMARRRYGRRPKQNAPGVCSAPKGDLRYAVSS